MYQLFSMDMLVASAGMTLLYLLGGAIYRLYLSPIAGFPGPKLAALTYWYETYFDVFRKGKFVFKIEDMHRKYGETSMSQVLKTGVRAMTSCAGSIVRKNPHELVIRDPEYYNELYVTASTRKTDSYVHFLGAMNLGGENSISHHINFFKLTVSRSSRHDRSA